MEGFHKTYAVVLADLRILSKASELAEGTDEFKHLGELLPEWYLDVGFAAPTKMWQAGKITEKGAVFLEALESIEHSPSRDAAFMLLADGIR